MGRDRCGECARGCCHLPLCGLTLHPVPHTLHSTPYALRPTPYTLHLTTPTSHVTRSQVVSLTLNVYPQPTTLNPTRRVCAWLLSRSPLRSLPAPCTLHPTPYTIHPTPYTLRPTPYALHPTPLHPTSYALHPTPYTLHPTLQPVALVYVVSSQTLDPNRHTPEQIF